MTAFALAYSLHVLAALIWVGGMFFAWMIRATNNGVTGLINPYGQITAQIPQFERGILYGEVVPMHNLTPYLQWRSWPLIVVCLMLFGWALLAGRMAKTV